VSDTAVHLGWVGDVGADESCFMGALGGEGGFRCGAEGVGLGVVAVVGLLVGGLVGGGGVLWWGWCGGGGGGGGFWGGGGGGGAVWAAAKVAVRSTVRRVARMMPPGIGTNPRRASSSRTTNRPASDVIRDP
jgi:hypothetical protein